MRNTCVYQHSLVLSFETRKVWDKGMNFEVTNKSAFKDRSSADHLGREDPEGSEGRPMEARGIANFRVRE